MLLVRRREKEDGFCDFWSIPGGGTEEEDFETALRREIYEELQCQIKWFEYFKSYFMKLSKNKGARSVYFYGEIEGEVILNKELSEYKWFDLFGSEIDLINFAYNQKEVLRDFKGFWKNKKYASNML